MICIPCRTRRSWVIGVATVSVVAALLSSAACRSKESGAGQSSQSQPAAPATAAPGKPLTADGQMQIGPGDRCPVCAMRVKSHARFSSAMQLDSGDTYYFCGTGCMLRTWLHPEQFLGRPKSTVRRAVVRDYFSGKQFDAQTATWVVGSDVVGPMGPAIVPLAEAETLSSFKERHGGKHTFKLSDLTDERWLELTGKKAGR